MNFKRILSLFLALMFTFGVIGEAVAVNAAYADKIDADGNPIINYFTEAYTTEADKLRDMTLFKEANGYQIYVEEFTGEIAFVDTKTGNSIFSNPYDLAVEGNVTSNTTKHTILSQILLDYEDNGEKKSMTSYTDAALRGQIKTKNIKNGIRMEYTIGEIMVTRLVPRRIPKDRFETLILEKITNEDHRTRIDTFYELYDTSDTKWSETLVKEIESRFPVTKRMAIYVCKPDIISTELKQLEAIIKTYCPLYTYDEMDQDHNETDYVGVDVAPPCFRMALEYTIGANGELDVRMPANGIRFDESVYALGDVSVLPFMGAGNLSYEGYTFIPDGSGSIIRFDDVQGTESTIAGKVYGPDFAYHTVQGKREQVMRYPVFGNSVKVEYEYEEEGTSKPGETAQTQKVSKNTGYVAIITEGDSMAQIITTTGGARYNYSHVYARFTPRPSDKYNLADSIAIAGDTSWTVVSKRKYSGSYKIKYILLSDQQAEGRTNYEASYVGMAKAYRDYLAGAGILNQLAATDVSENVPVYIETFGSIDTVDRFLSFPVDVDTPLTRFEDVKTMYNELTAAGVSNINFRLTGFANGGLNSTYPTKIKWVSALGGDSGFKDLVTYSEEQGFGVYPDFDFAYVAATGYFDGLSERRDAIKTIDSRYTSRKYYDSATQSLEDDFAKAISPSRYEYFCGKFTAAYGSFGTQKLSVSTLGNTLNSDFDKKDPYNREDSKQFTMEMLDALSQSFSDVMVNNGNMYSVQYADHILGIATDSSNYKSSSHSVPFLGFVLHGYKNYTGPAINMEGDIEYSILKTIENGASLYFTLSYDNINVLKESETYNKYYSVDYSVWKDEVAENYALVNEAMKGIQTSVMTNHSFMSGYRVPTKEDLAAEQAECDKKNAEAEQAAAEQAEKDKLNQLLSDRKEGATVSGSGNRTTPKYTVPTKTASDGTVYCTSDKYISELGSIVKVEYDNGTSFIINYNSYDVVITEGDTDVIVKALSFEKIN